MKILLVSSKYQPEYSGSGFRAHNTYKRLHAKFGIDYDVICSGVEYNSNEKYEYDGVKVYRIGKKITLTEYNSTASVYRKLLYHISELINYISHSYLTWKEIRNKNYDLIHTFGSSNSVSFTVIYGKYRNIPVLREVVNQNSSPKPALPLLIKKFIKFDYNKNYNVVAISKSIYNHCVIEGIDPSNIWNRPNPINELIFFPENNNKSKYRKELLGITDTDILLVCVSKFMPTKNQLFLLKVMTILNKKYKLLLKGSIIKSGPNKLRDQLYFEEIISTIKILKFEERVFIDTSFTFRIDKFLKAADVFIFPTTLEALGTPILESIACGIPVVANHIEGVTDQWIKDGKNGYLSTLDPKEFADKIEKAIEISKKVMLIESKKILKTASTLNIDNEYYIILNKMIKNNKSK